MARRTAATMVTHPWLEPRYGEGGRPVVLLLDADLYEAELGDGNSEFLHLQHLQTTHK
jgi:hypothetical protein